MDGDVLNPKNLIPFIEPPEGLSQKNTEEFSVLYRDETTMSRRIEAELGDLKIKFDRVVHLARCLSLVSHVLLTHGLVNSSNSGIVAIP